MTLKVLVRAGAKRGKCLVFFLCGLERKLSQADIKERKKTANG